MTLRRCLVTFGALFALATVSLLVSFLPWPERWRSGELTVALAIALAKALLVLFSFMHLLHQRFANQVAMLVSALLVGLLVALSAADVATRDTSERRPVPPLGQDFYRR